MAKLVKAPFDLISTLGKRMTGQQVLDALLAVYGEKGNGKSESCLYLAERLALWLSRYTIYQEKALLKQDAINGTTHQSVIKRPEWFFTIDNVRSVDQEGTLSMFTSQQLKERPNQVFIIDDASIASNARSFHTPENQRLNAIMTVARIYRHCVILNTIDPDLIDKVLRNFANITCVCQGPDMNPKSPTYSVNRLKVYAMSRAMAPALKNRRHYNKSFVFYDENKRLNRIISMRIRRPSDLIRGQYESIRKEKTDKLIDDLFQPIEGGVEDSRQPKKLTKREQELNADFDRWNMIIRQSMDENDGKVKITELIMKTGLSRERITKIVGLLHAGKE